jgi:hypothetical protein
VGFGALLSTKSLSTLNPDSLNNLTTTQIDSASRVNDSLNVRKITLQNLLAGGGNVMVQATYPIWDIDDRANALKFTLFAYNQFSFDIPALGVSDQKVAAINNFGTKVIFSWNLSNLTQPESSSLFSIFCNANISVINSYTGFFQDLGLNDTK